jgi:hypothetical protein
VFLLCSVRRHWMTKEAGIPQRPFLGPALRQFLLASVVTWAIVLLVAVAWSTLADDRFRDRFAHSAILIGVLFLLGGSGAMSRFTETGDSLLARRLIGPVPDNQEPGRSVGLTPLGLNLLVGSQFIVVGGLLA